MLEITPKLSDKQSLPHSLMLYIDNRLGDTPRHYLAQYEETLMLVPPEIRKCVVFLGIMKKKNSVPRLIGTGFFMAQKHGETSSILGFNMVFLISARHIVERGIDRSVDKKIYIRINPKDGAASWVASDASQWRFNPDDSSVDVAVLPWLPSTEKFDYLCIPENMTAKLLVDAIQIAAGLSCSVPPLVCLRPIWGACGPRAAARFF
ncbi:MAG: hypothetical protein IID52_09290, partial [Proteobacteria bacterium]|nr:hypothetical protein [Pseudomonadota bacterium]